MKQLKKFQRLRESENAVATKKFLTFLLGNDECAIDINFVREIKVSPSLIPVNKAMAAPQHMIGMTYLFDAIVPVADLRLFCLVDGEPNTCEKVIIFLKVQSYFFGIAIDKVMDVIEVPVDAIQPSPEIFSHCAHNFISEIAYIQQRLLAILNVEKLYASKSFQVAQLTSTVAEEGVNDIS